jgi:hypothetical protein
MDRAAQGAVVDGDDFTSQYMGPAQLAQARAEINSAAPVTPEQEAGMYLDTMVMIDGLDPNLIKERNPAETVEFAKAAYRINKAPPHLRNKLADALQAKLAGNDDKSLAADGVKLGREMLQEIVKDKESQFFIGSGESKKLDPKKVTEWMNFQQRVFMMEQEIGRRVKDVNDIQKVNQIVSDVVSADYVELKKNQYKSSSQAIPKGGNIEYYNKTKQGMVPEFVLPSGETGANPLLFPQTR